MNESEAGGEWPVLPRGPKTLSTSRWERLVDGDCCEWRDLLEGRDQAGVS